MRPEHEPKTVEQALGYLVEEAGEVLAAAGKSLRWGLNSSNPELLPEYREANRDWLKRELIDLERAIDRVRTMLATTSSPPRSRRLVTRPDGA